MLELVGLLLISAQVLALPPIEPHIIGGKPAEEGSYPYVASLRYSNGGFLCGGAVISDTFILTAAHCVELLNAKNFLIGVGSVDLNNQTLLKVQRIISHPKWSLSDLTNDIALVELAKPLNSSIVPINFTHCGCMDGKNVTAVGWGLINTDGFTSDNLMYLKRPILANDKCQKALEGRGALVTPTNICLDGELDKGACFGDSGSPLIYEENDIEYTVGIVSWGVPCAKGYPDVFTRVSSFVDWIKKYVKL